MEQLVITNWAAFLLQNRATFYYKVGQVFNYILGQFNTNQSTTVQLFYFIFILLGNELISIIILLYQHYCIFESWNVVTRMLYYFVNIILGHILLIIIF